MKRPRTKKPARRIVDLATYDERFITLGQLANYVGVDRRTMKAEWIDSGELPALKVGQRWRIEVVDAVEFMKRKKMTRSRDVSTCNDHPRSSAINHAT